MLIEYSSFEPGRRRRQHSAFRQGSVSSGPRGDAEDGREVCRTPSTRGHDAVPGHQRVLAGQRASRRTTDHWRADDGPPGARHNPDLAAQALEESRTEVEALLSRYSVVVVIGTGGKGTGAGTMFPVVQMARDQRKLVIPIFVRPSFERHEVDKRRYDHALSVVERFDSAKIRLMEILNDQGYAESDPQPQSVVWERMNRPIARGLRGLDLCALRLVAGRSVRFVHVCLPAAAGSAWDSRKSTRRTHRSP